MFSVYHVPGVVVNAGLSVSQQAKVVDSFNKAFIKVLEVLFQYYKSVARKQPVVRDDGR